MDSRLNSAGNCGVFSGINSNFYRLSNHIYIYIFPFFWRAHFTKSNILAINRCIHKGGKIREGSQAARMGCHKHTYLSQRYHTFAKKFVT